MAIYDENSDITLVAALKRSRLRAEQNEHAPTAANARLRAELAGRGSPEDRP